MNYTIPKNILSKGSTNYKTAKSVKEFQNYNFYILYLAPSLNNGHCDICPSRSEGCSKGCLYTAGRGSFSSVQNSRMNRTQYFINNTREFIEQLKKEVITACSSAKKQGKKAVFRLNGSSDIAFERKRDFFRSAKNNREYIQIDLTDKEGSTLIETIAKHGGIAYDYTKRIDRLDKEVLGEVYHLTFSRSEVHELECDIALELGFNLAVVFKNTLPAEYKGREVIDGDKTDFRFLEGFRGNIVGLIAKGKAKRDVSGFLVECSEGKVLTA